MGCACKNKARILKSNEQKDGGLLRNTYAILRRACLFVILGALILIATPLIGIYVIVTLIILGEVKVPKNILKDGEEL